MIPRVAEQYGHNELVQAVLTQNSRERLEEMRLEVEMKTGNPAAGEELLLELKNAVRVLDKKVTSLEALEFKKVLYEIAEAVVNASGEGFMGSGPAIREKEALFMMELQAILGV